MALDDYEAPIVIELREQFFRDTVDRSIHKDHVERRGLRATLGKFAGNDARIGNAERLKILSCPVGQALAFLKANYLGGQRRENGCGIAGATPHIEYAVFRGYLGKLQQFGERARIEQGACAVEGNAPFRISDWQIGGRYETLAGYPQHGIADASVGHIVGAELSRDHVGALNGSIGHQFDSRKGAGAYTGAGDG